jgi:hypothetical protein
MVAALNQGDLSAEAELAADRPAAEHDHALGHLLGRGRIAVVPGFDSVESVDRRHRCFAAGGDHDCSLGAENLAADADSPLGLEARLAPEQVDLAFFQPRQLPRVIEVVDHLVAAIEDRLRLELPVAGGNPGNSLRLAEHVGRPQQCLRGHAGVVRAFAAD